MDYTPSVIATLAYFDLFDRPLTREELERWLWRPEEGMAPRLGMTGAHLGSVDGYYCLPGRESIVPAYQARVWIVEKKMKIAVRAAKKLRWTPFVRAVFVSNTVAMNTPRAESDIDFFIVARHGRTWTARLFVTLLLSLFRLRRGHAHVRDRACLCFYASDASLDLSGIRIQPDDIYLAYWVDQLRPVYDPEDVSSSISKANTWVKEFLPGACLPRSATRQWRADDRLAPRAVRNTMEFFLGNRCERVARYIQKRKMRLNTQSVQDAPDTRVVVSDTMLKFHENDRRAWYYSEWKKKEMYYKY